MNSRDRSREMLRDVQPFINYLEKKTGAKIAMTIPTNYAAVVEAMANDQVDIAHFGGFTFVQISARAGAKPLVQREQDQKFHSLFITQPSSGINNLKDLNGHTFAFGDVNSTSGHLMPEYYMREAKVDSRVIERALYTGGHDATALAVANKKVDAGALDEKRISNHDEERQNNRPPGESLFGPVLHFSIIVGSAKGS